MKTENNFVNVNESIAYTLSQLKKKHDLWEEQSEKTNNMLYRLMNECLSLYKICSESEIYEEALKSSVTFKFGKKTRLTVIICKAVFGAGKKHYVYAKALDRAVEEQVGVSGNIGMFEWLKLEGGVNGVIRKSKKSSMRENAEFGEYVLDGYYNFEKLKGSLKSSFIFENKAICDIVDEQKRSDCFLYAVVERGGDKVKIQPIPIAENDIMKKMYAVFLSYVAEIGGEKYYDEFTGKKMQREAEHEERVMQAKKDMAERLVKIASIEAA
jgi:hypothetical protein